METVILCGGLGTRLGEETVTRPKPMVEVGDRPILWHIMKIFAHYGHTDFILCLGYRGNVIREYFRSYEYAMRDFTVTLGTGEVVAHEPHPEAGWRVTLAETGAKAMTGARVKRARKYVKGERFFLTYGDGVSDVDLAAALLFHRSHGKLATVTGVHPSSRFGELIVEGNRVVDFVEKPQLGSGLVNGGFFICERGVFDYLRDDDGCVLELEGMQGLVKDGQLMVHPHLGYWHCVDTVRDLQHLRNHWDSGHAPWKVWK